MSVKKIFIALAIVALAALAVESLSAYVLFRHYAADANAMRPKGSAAVFLLGRLAAKSRGARKSVDEAVDHGPLFEKNDVLGFALHPGRYHITETVDNFGHFFDLTIDAHGHRVTSYEPVKSPKRLIITGDSALFGWGLDDEETLPWLLQTRLPGFQVLNLTRPSYSTMQAILELRQLQPAIGPDDIVVLEYQHRTDLFNVAADELLQPLRFGYEIQLGDPASMSTIDVPYGVVDADGKFSMHRINLSCAAGKPGNPDCARPQVDASQEMRVTQAAFDQILDLHPGHSVVAVIQGRDTDPVISHLLSRGVAIADFRTYDGYPDLNDVILTDSHPGPFWHHQVFGRLLDALIRNHLVE